MSRKRHSVWNVFADNFINKTKASIKEVAVKERMNIYSISLAVIMVLLILKGGSLVFSGNLWGLPLLIFGVMMVLGIKQPKEQPRRVRLVTLFGQKTTTKEERIALFLDWLPIPLVGYVEFLMLQVDKDIELKKPIKCKAEDGTDNKKAYLYGIISVSLIPNEHDDGGDPGDLEWKSGGKRLRDFDNAGGTQNMGRYDTNATNPPPLMEPIFSQLDDILTAWLQHFGKHMTVDWMEENGIELGILLLPCITGKEGVAELKERLPVQFQLPEMRQALTEIENSPIDDASGLGIEFKKFQCILRPHEDVIEARNRYLIEKADRVSELENTINMNRKIEERAKLHRNGIKDEQGNVVIPPDAPDKQPTTREIRTDVLMEDLRNDEKVTVVLNQGGINFVQAPPTSGGNP